MMTCDEIVERLDAFVDGAGDEAAFQEIELHLAGCAACREEERALRDLLAEAAALPKSVQPARDLWPDVAARIAAGGVRARRARIGWTIGLAAAAALAALASARLLRPAPAAAPRQASASPARIVPAAVGSDDLLPAEEGYVRATGELMNVLAARRDRLSPETLKVVQQNLDIIDEALGQVREALRKDPGNRQLTRMLTATHQRKVDVLRRVVGVAS